MLKYLGMEELISLKKTSKLFAQSLYEKDIKDRIKDLIFVVSIRGKQVGIVDKSTKLLLDSRSWHKWGEGHASRLLRAFTEISVSR